MVETHFARFLKLAGPLPVVGLLGALAAVLLATARNCGQPQGSLSATLGDLKPVHAGVNVAGERVSWLRRLAVGERVVTDAEGRARVRLDDGTTAVIDHDSRVVLSAKGLSLEAGRMHVTSPVGAHTEVVLGSLDVLMSGATAGLDNRGGKLRVYAADGELSVRLPAGGDQRVHSGESAVVDGAKLAVVAERAYDDWTSGLARPWAARGIARRAVGELWGIDRSKAAGSAGSPLTIRAHRVKATIDRELAHTTSETTFFNGGSVSVDGDFRVALPPGALVSGFAVTRNGTRQAGQIALAARSEPSAVQQDGVLEWAGDGWLRGKLGGVEPGQELKLSVEYTEWLSPRRHGDNLLVQYRYPLVGDSDAPLIGEFSANVDASPTSPLALAAGYGARSDGHAAVVSRSDFRPSADFVVDVEERRGPNRARLYVAPPEDSKPALGSAVLLRAELPSAEVGEGVTLALVVDTSGSVDPAMLDAERALVDALLGGLGARDRVVVLASDQATSAVGPKELGPVDAARRKAISQGLSSLSPGGASDLGRALEVAADALPADAPAGMVIYVGDGWPTLGDGGPDAISARLARRTSGAPRIGAVAVGALANRRLLSALTRGSGPLFEVTDSADAARVAIELMSDALRPALAGVEVDLGPEVDQVYPRTARALVAGETLSVVGRIRGKPPSSIKIRYRDARGMREEVRAVDVLRASDPDDVRRRWAAERVEEIVLHGTGREAATDVALQAGLVTPWTAFKTGGGEYAASSLHVRVLDLASDGVSVVGPVLATPGDLSGTLAAFEGEMSSSPGLPDALEAAVRRGLDGAAPAVHACRDSRVALRPELAGSLEVSLSVDGDGLPHDVKVRGITVDAEDPALDRCVQLVVEGLRFPRTDTLTRVKVTRSIQLPPSPRSLGARTCSDASRLSMPLRRGAWWTRLQQVDATSVYREAKQRCELPTWTSRRALLELVLDRVPGGVERVNVAYSLEMQGDADAATLVRREAVRRARSPEELRDVRTLLLRDERYPGTVFEQRYRAAANDTQRLEVVGRFLSLAPHDSRLRRRQIALLDALGKKAEILELTRLLRTDPFADALLLCDAASALRRAGFDDEARRTFGELAERAPRDPWVRGLLGDRLRNEGWFDDANAAYEVLEQLAPDDARSLLRAALAHAGAGRLDLALRLLMRVAQTGGRAADAGLGELSRELGRSLASEALSAGKPLEATEKQQLRRIALELSQAETDSVLLLRAAPGAPELQILLERGTGATKESRAPDVSAPSLGLYLYRVSDEDPLGSRMLSAARPADLAPSAATALRLDRLSSVKNAPPSYRSDVLLLPSDGKRVEFHGR